MDREKLAMNLCRVGSFCPNALVETFRLLDDGTKILWLAKADWVREHFKEKTEFDLIRGDVSREFEANLSKDVPAKIDAIVAYIMANYERKADKNG